jgi:leucyl aminopeptidase
MASDTVTRSASKRAGSARASFELDYVVLERTSLQINVKKSPASQAVVDILVIGAFPDAPLSPAARAIDAAAGGKLSKLIKRGDLDVKAGSSLMLFDVDGTAAQRVLLVSLGARDKFNDSAFFAALGSAAKILAGSADAKTAVTLAQDDVPSRSLAWRLQQASRILADGGYRFDAPKEKPNGKQTSSRGARSIDLLIDEDITEDLEFAVRSGQAIAEGMALTKDLGNLPGNVCHPGYLADTARKLGKELGFEVEVLERADMEKLGMYSALSVGRASDQPCRFIIMNYRGAGPKGKPIVLIGKGVTFDTGGISLKPGEDLDMMKYDMCGAASVFGAMKTVASLALPINLVGIVGAAENMPGGNATRPGDVVRSMSGLTIEVLNTDAEGRLILCDALTYAERFNPDCVIDIATLTGACVIALGAQTSGLYANDDELAEELLACGTQTGDRAWRMPMFEEYHEQLKSNFADMSNLGGRPAGSVTAACFLSRFATAYRWAHLDIAGTASVGGDAKGATGRPIPLLSEFLITRAQRSTAE